jgi:hypothetical protein
MWSTLPGSWEVLSPFEWCIRHNPTSKNISMSCHWKCWHILFLLEWRVLTMVVWFVSIRSFFIFLLFISSPWKVQVGPLYCWYFNFNPYYFISNFYSWPFYESLIFFSISSINSNLTYIIFYKLILILFIFNFFSLILL